MTSGLWEEARESAEADRFEAFAYSLLSVWTIMWNQDGSNPFFTDPQVRKAMVLALDRPAFIAGVVRGLARPGATTYHPDTVWADPAIVPRPFDPAQASRLLDAAGWHDGDGDGIRERDGREFRFSLIVPVGSQQLTDHIARMTQAND